MLSLEHRTISTQYYDAKADNLKVELNVSIDQARIYHELVTPNKISIIAAASVLSILATIGFSLAFAFGVIACIIYRRFYNKKGKTECMFLLILF